MTYPAAAIDKAFSILPAKMDTRHARIQLAAIGFQESKYLARRQIIKKDGKLVQEGPAASFWQFENGRLSGINGVLTHATTATTATEVCRICGVLPERMAVWERMQFDDVLGAAFARLLMWTDSGRIPTSESEGWAMYLRTWRPGKPHPEEWPASWRYALSVVKK